MDDQPTTEDGRTAAAWILKADPTLYDVFGALEAFGVITAWPVADTARIMLMEPGQQVFLHVGPGAEGKASGIWAAGEVVGEPFTAHEDDIDSFWLDDETARANDRYLPVELLPLSSPVTDAQLTGHGALASLELFTDSEQLNPNLVQPDQLEALESFDLTVLEPTEEQLENLADLVGPDFALAINDGSMLYAVVDDGEDDLPWRVISVEQPSEGEGSDDEYSEEDEKELGAYAELADALDSVMDLLADIGSRAPIIDLAANNDLLEPIVTMPLEDGGVCTIIRLGPEAFTLMFPSDDEDGTWEPEATYPDLPSAIAELFAEDDF